MTRSRLLRILALSSLLVVTCASFSRKSFPDCSIIDRQDYIVYVPHGLAPGRAYPLVIALSPFADAPTMIGTWKQVAEKNKWIIFASKEFKDNIQMGPVCGRIREDIGQLSAELPIDTSRVIATGFSGGGMASHDLACLYPDLISAVIVNTGMISRKILCEKEHYPHGKIAVFLASPQDKRYKQMQEDRELLSALGWKTKWIEFRGGHTIAPYPVYKEAAAWVQTAWLARK